MKVLLPFVFVVLFVAFTTADTVGDSADEIENEESFLEKRAKCPIITFPCGPNTVMPNVCNNMRDAINIHSKSKLLHRVSKEDSKKNRVASGCPKLTKRTRRKRKRKIPKLSCDEYPFASSKEGGKGAIIKMVPAKENSRQGGLLGGFYKREKIGVGDCYKVKVK